MSGSIDGSPRGTRSDIPAMDADTRSRWSTRAVLVGLLAAALAAVPVAASAHALLVSASPQAGARLGTAPGLVRLIFSEPLNAKLSRATVTDPSGVRFVGTISTTQIQVPLTTNSPGLYRVDWTSVSADDGHTVRGSYSFTVVAKAAGRSSAGSGSGPSAPDLLIGGLRAIEFLALL